MVNFFAWWIIRLSCAGLPVWFFLNTGKIGEAVMAAMFASGVFWCIALYHRDRAMMSHDHEQAYRAYLVLSLVTTIGAAVAAISWLRSFETGLVVLGIWTAFILFLVAVIVLFIWGRGYGGKWPEFKLSAIPFLLHWRKAR